MPLLLAGPLEAAEPIARAVDTAGCARNYERAQEERVAGRLQAALGHLQYCRNEGCPAFVRADCELWSSEVESELPSIVVLVRMPGDATPEGVLRVDGEVMGRGAPGDVISLDPGMHRLTWEPPGKPAMERQVVVQQGVQDRTIEFDFRPPPSPLPEESIGRDAGASLRPWAFASLGIGAIGLGAFGTLGWIARVDNKALRADCPTESTVAAGPGVCLAGDVEARQQSIGDKNLMADLSLGAGVVGVIAGAVMLMVSSPASEGAGEPLGWTFDVQQGGASASLSGRF